MKQVEIATAIIMKDHKILTTRRGYGQFINLCFPAGKSSPAKPPKMH